MAKVYHLMQLGITGMTNLMESQDSLLYMTMYQLCKPGILELKGCTCTSCIRSLLTSARARDIITRRYGHLPETSRHISSTGAGDFPTFKSFQQPSTRALACAHHPIKRKENDQNTQCMAGNLEQPLKVHIASATKVCHCHLSTL